MIADQTKMTQILKELNRNGEILQLRQHSVKTLPIKCHKRYHVSSPFNTKTILMLEKISWTNEKK